MRIVDIDKIQWYTGPGHRDPGLFLKDVLTGAEGRGGNYWLSLIKVEEKYDAPPHRHNFDQVRVMLEGAFNFGPQDQETGTIGYFSEGTPYKQTARGPSVTLLLQCEGGSAARYISQAELRQGIEALMAAGGAFEGGRYRGPDPVGGEEVKKDSFEAIWEQVAGQRLTYPKPRYRSAVIVDPAAFAYVDVPDCVGVQEKNLGVFNERKLGIAMWKFFAPEGHRTYRSEAKTLFYVKSGAVTLNGNRLGANFVAEVSENEDAEFSYAQADPEVLILRLPA